MVYRFAVIGAFSAFVLADLEPPKPLQWGHLKGFVLRHLRWWSDKKDIFKSDGTLNIGYGFDNMNMTENYNAPGKFALRKISGLKILMAGSPYWCMKAFGCLAGKPDHPFWASTELPWPTDLFPSVKAIPDTGHLMCRSGGHTFLLSSGQKPHYAMRHGPAKYAKFSYSATFGFSCPTGDMDLEQLSADSMIALRDDTAGVEQCDGESWRVRRQTFDAEIVGRGTEKVHLRSRWRPWSDVLVETILLPPAEGSNWYIRLHKVETGRKLKSADAGWSTYGQGPDGRPIVQAFSGIITSGDEELGWTRASTKTGCVGVLDLPVGEGQKAERQGRLVQTDPNSNVIFSRSVLPTLLGEVEVGTSWIATAVFGLPGGEADEAEYQAAWGQTPKIPDWILAEIK